jgi:spore maturation protein SpmA
MLNYIWLGLIVCAVVIGGCTHHIKEMTDGAFAMAKTAVMDVGLPLIGIMSLWLGVMRLAEKSGMVKLLARVLQPVMVRLFPDVPPEHPAMGSMVMNMAANMLGLLNAATPLGLRAMEDLESLNPRPGTATNAMCTFLAINTSSIQLIPVTAVGILAVRGAANPSSIIITSLVASVIAACSAIIAVKIFEKLPMFRLPAIMASDEKEKSHELKEMPAASEPEPLAPLSGWRITVLVAYFAFFAVVFLDLAFPQIFGGELSAESQKEMWFMRVLNAISLVAIPLMLSFFPLYAALRGLMVYEEFVTGAKEGFNVVVRIIPNLVTILVAIGMFRGAGGIDLLTNLLTPVMKLVHFPPELLPLAMMRPLSGNGTLGVFTDVVIKYGPDNILSKIAGTMQGSSETTFYVLAVYFGAVNIKRTRHAVPAGLVADMVSLIASVFICKMAFG